MKNILIAGGLVLWLAAASVTPATAAEHTGELYRASEMSLDFAGTASAGSYTINHLSGARLRHNAQLGIGGGINYYFTRHVGVGADAYSENTTGSLADSISASLLLRLPLAETGFAPYGFVGVGRQFDLGEAWFAQLGGGLEYRFTPRVGLFTDLRLAVPHETKYYGVARLGLRFAF